jgi:hypothetical protein
MGDVIPCLGVEHLEIDILAHHPGEIFSVM